MVETVLPEKQMIGYISFRSNFKHSFAFHTANDMSIIIFIQGSYHTSLRYSRVGTLQKWKGVDSLDTITIPL